MVYAHLLELGSDPFTVALNLMYDSSEIRDVEPLHFLLLLGMLKKHCSQVSFRAAALCAVYKVAMPRGHPRDSFLAEI